MSRQVAEKAVAYMFARSTAEETVNIGFFGGEPLLDFALLKDVTKMIVNHPLYDEDRVVLRIVSNGTVYSSEIADFLERYKIGLGLSYDGLPWIQDQYRPFVSGAGSAPVVEKNLQTFLGRFPLMPVNAVFNAETFRLLPHTVDYLSSLGVRNIHLNPDIGGKWTGETIAELETIYADVAEKYLSFYLDGDPHYISLIDSKIAVLLRGGYRPDEKCSMGTGELAIGVTGNLYPCERLVGADDGATHCIGHIDKDRIACTCGGSIPRVIQTLSCHDCSLQDYCMHWCGCTNFFGTGDYNRVNQFICSSEKAAIRAAIGVIERTRDAGISFPDHLQGTPLMSIIGEVSS